MVLDMGFQFLYRAHIGPVRALVQRSPKLREVRLGPGRIDLHAAVVQVPGEAVETQSGSPTAHEVTVPDALYAPADEPPPRLDLPGHEYKNRRRQVV